MLSAQARIVASDPRAHSRAELVSTVEELRAELDRMEAHAAEARRLRVLDGQPPASRGVRPPQWRDAARLYPRPSGGDAA